MARAFDAAGDAVLPNTTRAAPQVIAECPSGAALAQALAAGVFRIGGNGAAPVSGFETLTAGSSGVPRRIARTHRSWTASFAVNAATFGVGPGRRVAVLGRLSHSLSLYGAVEALHLGAELHLLDDLRPDRQRLALAARSVDMVYATPAQLRLMFESKGPDLPAMRWFLVGGSKLDAVLRRRIAAVAPQADLREFYGAAETSFITLADPACPTDAVGRPYPGVQLDIRDTAGEVLAQGRTGQVWVKSAYLFDGYAGSDVGGAVWRDGWLSVGEIGHLTAGYLTLSGRAGRMVTVADQNVFPEAIEAHLALLPYVRNIAVLPRNDGLRGFVLVAVAEGDASQEAALLAAGRAEFGPLKAPRAVIWRDEWPRLPSGKSDLRRLAQEAGL